MSEFHHKEEDAQRDRVVRVFLSSTFRDMQAEREELIKRIFPQLRKLCEQRGVTWGEVDLRWGVTDEQKAEGKVLPICLEEIKRCRPFFIGLLGERYGWVSEEIPRHLLEQETWLEEHLTHSVTELEILHGVLNNPVMAQHAFFYLRDPAYLERLPTGASIADYQSENDTSRQKLDDLKARIRQSKFVVREDYHDPHTLGELVLRDMTDVINRLFPEGSQPEPLDREAAEHDAFAQSRAGVYIGRQEYFNRLDAHVAGDGPPLVVLGESGSGKSALLANWAIRYQQAHPDDLLIMHFIGASPYSTDWAAMLRRIMGEFKRRFNITQEIPDKPDDLRTTFANWLCMAAVKGKVILILDALNQLEDRDGAPDLVWLPPVIPPNIRLILSTLAGRSLEDLKKRAWPTLIIQPLSLDERQQFVHEYLAQYTKSLDSMPARRIVVAPQTANPLYLQALLEELRVFGVFERLNERIDYYLEATTIPQLYQRIFRRWEEDYETERAEMVQDALSLLWASRRGLSEAELLDLLGAEGNSLPRAIWSPFYLAAERSLMNRSGLIGFNHDYLREAVALAYLHGRQEMQLFHVRLADYFEKRNLDARKLDELPWQIAAAGQWERLRDLLTDSNYFVALWAANQYDLKTFWVQLEENAITMVDTYRFALETSVHSASYHGTLGKLLIDTGHPTEAILLWTNLVEHYRNTEDAANLQASLGNLANALNARGDIDRAITLYREEERICRELGNQDGLQRSLGNQAVLLEKLGDLDSAMNLHKEEERICRDIEDDDGLWRSIGNQALILMTRGDLNGAMALQKETERFCREHGNLDGLQRSLGHQANILMACGNLDSAIALYRETEELNRKIGNRVGLYVSLGNQANILYTRGDLNGAMALRKEEERIIRELGYKDPLSTSIGNQAIIMHARGDLDGAMALHKEEERICRETGNKDNLHKSIGNQALILYVRGNLNGAMAMQKDKERICRELGNTNGLAISLANQMNILIKMGELAEGLSLAEEAYSLATDHGFVRLAEQIKPILDRLRVSG